MYDIYIYILYIYGNPPAHSGVADAAFYICHGPDITDTEHYQKQKHVAKYKLFIMEKVRERDSTEPVAIATASIHTKGEQREAHTDKQAARLSRSRADCVQTKCIAWSAVSSIYQGMRRPSVQIRKGCKSMHHIRTFPDEWILAHVVFSYWHEYTNSPHVGHVGQEGVPAGQLPFN